MPLIALLAIEFAAMLENVDLRGVDAGEEITRIRTLVHLALSDGKIPFNDWKVVMAESNTLRRVLTARDY